jgi:AcrR family transcriptional regulator
MPTISETEQIVSDKREEIIEKAIEIFCKKGFTRASIIDIAKAAGLGKSSFYFYFKDKEDLFIECLAHLGRVLLSKEKEVNNSQNEQDVVSTQRIAASLYFNYFSYYGGIINSLKMFLKSDDQKKVMLAKEAFKKFIQPIVSFHRHTINIGVMRELDEVLVGYAILGLSDIMGYVLLMNANYSIDDVVDFGIDFVNHGILACNGKSGKQYQSGPINFEVTDSQGIKTRIWNAFFAEKKYISGSIGKESFKVNLADIFSMTISQTGSMYSALITLKTGSQSTLEIKGEGVLSGQSHFGEFRLPVKKIAIITRMYPNNGEIGSIV